METCRALGAAVKNGWKPRRTLVYASWDAEEYGLVGSTEWAEANADELKKKAVLMLNVDSAVSGPEVGFSGVPSLRDFVLEAAGAITDVRTGRTLRDSWTEARRKAWAGAGPARPRRPGLGRGTGTTRGPRQRAREFFPQMNSLGSGSDYTAFVDHLGIPAVDSGLRGGYGVYHSIYDDFNWMEKFGDPEFLNHATAARLYTLIAMRAAAADVVPMRFVPYGLALREHVDELRLISRPQEAAGGRPSPSEPGQRVRGRPRPDPGRPGLPGAGGGSSTRSPAEPRPAATDSIARASRRSTTRSRRSSGPSCSTTGSPAVPGSSTRSTPPG